MIHKLSCLPIWLSFIILMGGGSATGKSPVMPLRDSVRHYAHELIRNKDLKVRERAFEYLNEHLNTFLENFADFRDTFPRFEGLAVLEDLPLKVRMITYQLYRDTSSYEYGGWIQSDQLKTPVYLNDASNIWENDQDLDYMDLDAEHWYGALYYQMHPLSLSGSEQTFLLFGLDNYHFFTKRKILETLVIEEGQLHFGKSVIEMEEGLPEEFRKKRFVLDYSVQAPATFRYDQERDKIIFDHLIFMASDIPQQKIMRVPDGTYSGFEIDQMDQKLTFIEKVFDEVMEEAPDGREKTEVKRDLLGNPEKN